MKKINKVKTFFVCLVCSVITTFAVMVVSFLMMLFESSDDGYRETLFRTIFFDSVTDADGAVTLTFGLTENYLPLLIIAGGIFAFFFLTSIIYGRLCDYREKLIQDRQGNA